MKIFKKKSIWVLVTLLAVAFLIIKNNKEQFKFIKTLLAQTDTLDAEELPDAQSTEEEFGSDDVPPSRPPPDTIVEITAAPEETVQEPAEKMDDEVQKFEPTDRPEKFPELRHTTPRFICPLEMDHLLYVVLKIQIIFTGKKLQKEIKFRETDIKGIIQNIVYKSERAQLKADPLRKKIKESLGELLHGGTINDIVFKDFKIEIRKK